MSGRRSTKLIATLGAVVAFIGGMFLHAQVTSPKRDASTSASISTLTDRTAGRRATHPSSERPHDGVARASDGSDGSARSAPTEDGAVATALDLAAASQAWMYLSDKDLEASVRAVASTHSADRLVSEIVGEVRVARDALARSPGRIWWLVRPLAWRVESFGPQRAQVSVWTVSVLSAADVALPQSDWFTTTLDLAWENAAWRLVATRDAPGPTPQLGGRDSAWKSGPFDHALAGFARVGAEVGS